MLDVTPLCSVVARRGVGGVVRACIAFARMLDVTPSCSHLHACSMLRHCVPLLRGRGWGWWVVRACSALAHMLDVTPSCSAVAPAHMLDVTPLCSVVAGRGVGAVGCKSVHCTYTHAGCYAILFRCSTCAHARCYAIVFRCCGEGGGGGGL